MTFEQFLAVVRDWQSRLTPDQAREATERLAGGLAVSLDVMALLATIDAGAVWVFAAGGKPVAEHDVSRFLRRPAPPLRKKAARAPPLPPVIDAVPLAPAPAHAAAAPPEPPPCTARPPRRGQPKVAERARARCASSSSTDRDRNRR